MPYCCMLCRVTNIPCNAVPFFLLGAVDLGLFVCVAIFCLFEIWRNHRMMQRVPSLVKSNAGFSVWKWFHIFLFFANSTRAGALVIEMYLDDSVQYDILSWYITLAHTLPDLLFLR